MKLKASSTIFDLRKKNIFNKKTKQSLLPSHSYKIPIANTISSINPKSILSYQSSCSNSFQNESSII